jgi:hypothetical protein
VREGKSYVSLSQSTGFGLKSTAPSYELFPTDAAVGLFAAGNDEAHFYMECSGKGECNRASGECTCQEGYTGSACQRTTCPNDCSGHGLCRTLKEVASGARSRKSVSGQAGNIIFSGVREAFDYALWDADKHQMCICDAGFSGIDCSSRSCPRGDDPLTPQTQRWCGGQACVYEVQRFKLSSAVTTTYKWSWTDLRNQSLVAYFTVDTSTGVPGYVADPSTSLPGPTTNAGLIMNALRAIPGGQMQLVEVRALGGDPSQNGDLVLTFDVTFSGISGNQYLMAVETVTGPGSLAPGFPAEQVQGNMEDLECSGRGICDLTSGLCGCFAGYFGVACEYQNALTAGTTGAAAGVISAAPSGASAHSGK